MAGNGRSDGMGSKTMKVYESIQSGFYADVLLADKKHSVSSWSETSYGNLYFRRCHSYGFSQRKLNRGAVVSLTPKHFDHGKIPIPFVNVRLKPGWTRKTLSRAIFRLFYQAALAYQIAGRRERVYQAWKSYEHDPKISTIVFEGETRGHTSIYTEMTEEDCTYWMNQLKQLEGKT